LKDFSITSWYNDFKEVCIPTVIIEMTTELLSNLRSDELDCEIVNICQEHYVKRIKDALQHFNNEAFVKNNWHAPVVCFKCSFSWLFCYTKYHMR